jgi:hypothetical protein
MLVILQQFLVSATLLVCRYHRLRVDEELYLPLRYQSALGAFFFFSKLVSSDVDK